MAKVVLIARVEDPSTWESRFRTHGELFKKLGVSSPIQFGMGENNEVVLVEEVPEPDTLLAQMDSADNVAAMREDGVDPDSVRVFIIDRDFAF